jgi:hypothetical protein
MLMNSRPYWGCPWRDRTQNRALFGLGNVTRLGSSVQSYATPGCEYLRVEPAGEIGATNFVHIAALIEAGISSNLSPKVLRTHS